MTHSTTPQFIEEGHALSRLMDASQRPATPGKSAAGSSRDRLDVIVIGAGQAGLSVGYHLAKQGLRFVILDGEQRVGDTWRKRWDSLRLFTPACFDGLDGMPFPAHPDYFPTKDEMADYLEAYAARFELPVRSGVRVERLSRVDGRYVVRVGKDEFVADHVVVAMASYQKRRVPELAAKLRSDVVQLHSSEYRGPADLRAGPVLIVGAGNSGAEIANELCRQGHRTLLAGRDVGEVPFKSGGFWARTLLLRLVLRFVFHHVLTIKTPMGRKARPGIISKGGPLIRVKAKELVARGVERVGRVTGTKDGLPTLDDGRTLDVSNVIWCTGFDGGFSWIDLPIFEPNGEPIHEGGLVTGEPGLYFVGLHFLYSMSSTMIHGVGRDAGRIAGEVAKRVTATEAGAGRAELQAKMA